MVSANACSMRRWYITIHATVMLKICTNTISISSLGIPHTTVDGLFVDNDTCTKECERCFVVVKHTMNCCICRQFGIEATIVKKIQCDCCLGKKTIPLFVRILGICNTEARNEVFLVGLNVPLRSIESMNTGKYYLVPDIVL